MFKKIKFWLEHLDGVWSFPLSIAAFWIAGIVLSWIFGWGTGSYDPGFIQAFFLACIIVIGATNVTIWGVRFNFKGLYRYLWGYKNDQGETVNPSKDDWKNLPVCYRFVIAFSVFLLFFVAILLVFLKLV